MLRTAGRRLRSPGRLLLQVPGKSGLGGETHDTTRSSPVPGLGPCAPSLLPRLVSDHLPCAHVASTRPPSSLRTEDADALNEVPARDHPQVPKSLGFVPRCPSRKEDLASGTQCSTPQRLSCLHQQNGSLFATAYGTPTAPHPTQMWLPLGHSSAAPSTTTQHGTRAARRALRATCRTCATHTLWKL